VTLCHICEWRYAVVKGRCRTCYLYWRRTGRDRPEELVIRHAQRVLERMHLTP
jgi:hypothetical protein